MRDNVYTSAVMYCITSRALCYCDAMTVELALLLRANTRPSERPPTGVHLSTSALQVRFFGSADSRKCNKAARRTAVRQRTT